MPRLRAAVPSSGWSLTSCHQNTPGSAKREQVKYLLTCYRKQVYWQLGGLNEMAAQEDQIRQWEIAALYHLEVAKDVIALGFKRRLEAGATVQPGPYVLEPDTDAMQDLEEEQREYSGGGFNCVGFDGVGRNDKPARDTDRK